jgi:hypothetical protein
MNIVSDITLFDKSKVMFLQQEDKSDHDIKYIEPSFTTTGFTTSIQLIDVAIVTRYYNTVDIEFDPAKNMEIVNQLGNIENTILNKLKIENKLPKYDLLSTIQIGKIKVCLERNKIKLDCPRSIIMRIRSVWQTPDNYGLYYKFYV